MMSFLYKRIPNHGKNGNESKRWWAEVLTPKADGACTEKWKKNVDKKKEEEVLRGCIWAEAHPRAF